MLLLRWARNFDGGNEGREWLFLPSNLPQIGQLQELKVNADARTLRREDVKVMVSKTWGRVDLPGYWFNFSLISRQLSKILYFVAHRFILLSETFLGFNNPKFIAPL